MTGATPLPDVLTSDLLAKLLDCTPERVDEAARARVLPGIKYGRSWAYPRDAVMQVLTTQALANVRAVEQAEPKPKPRAAASVANLKAAAQVAGGHAGRRQQRRSPAPLPDPPGG